MTTLDPEWTPPSASMNPAARVVRESDRQIRAEMIERLHRKDCHHHPLSDHTPDVALHYGQQVDAVMEVAAGFRRGGIASGEPGPGDETHCHRCGGPNRPWSAPSPLWNEVMRGGSINGDEIHDGIVCPTCFVVLAEEAGVASLWRLAAERITAELETVTPSGRVYDWTTWMWREPAKLDSDGTGQESAPILLVCPETASPVGVDARNAPGACEAVARDTR